MSHSDEETNAAAIHLGHVTEDHALPRPLPWVNRFGGSPWLGGPVEEQAAQLKTLLERINEAEGYVESVIKWPDDESSTPIKKPMRGLASSGVLEKQGRDRVAISESATRWMHSQDPRELVALLHSNVRFFGEILAVLAEHEGLTHEKVAQVARSDYGLTWRTLDPVRKRVGWLRSTGMVTFDFDREIRITEEGRAVLAVLEVTSPSETVNTRPPLEGKPASVPPASPEVQALLDSLTHATLRSRKATLGYIPRLANGDVVDSIRAIVAACVPETTRDRFYQSCASTFGSKESSAISALYTLRSIGLLEQISVDGFAAADAAVVWLDSDDDVDLVRIVHANIAYVGELISATDDANKSPALVDYMRETYGADLDVSGVRGRLHLLLACGLLEQSAWAQYRPTRLGRAVAAELPMCPALEQPESGDGTGDPHTHGLGDALAQELTEAATDSAHPERFEQAVCDSLTYLGMDAEHLGGPGRTDVLVRLPARLGEERRIIIDTKATGSGVVTDALVNFDALRDHLAKHKAVAAALVGPSFGEGRIKKWAQEHKVTLIEAAFLVEVLRNEDRTPVGPTVLSRMFEADGAGVRSIRDAWADAQHQVELLRAVFEVLAGEAREPDEVTKGALSAEHLYLLLRPEMDPKPRTEDIKVALTMLDSPYLQAVTKRGEQYALSEPAVAVARRLRVLAKVFQGVADRPD